MQRRILLCLICAAAVAAPAALLAQTQVPARSPVKLLVPVPPGGTSDLVARALAAQLAKNLGRPVVVENRPGATGQIAADLLRHARPDGTTLMLAPIALPVLAPLVNPRMSYDPSRELVPVAQVARYPFAIAVRADHPARDVRELVAWVNANPARADFGTAGAASVPHFIGLLIAKATGVKWQHVPHRGAGDVQTEILNGDIAVGIGAASDLLQLQRAGRLRIIGTSGSSRAPLLEAVPTFQEQEIAVEAVGWTALFAPRGTPRAVIEELSAAAREALASREVRDNFQVLGVEPTGTTPEELATIIEGDKRRWSPIVRAAGYTPE